MKLIRNKLYRIKKTVHHDCSKHFSYVNKLGTSGPGWGTVPPKVRKHSIMKFCGSHPRSPPPPTPEALGFPNWLVERPTCLGLLCYIGLPSV